MDPAFADERNDGDQTITLGEYLKDVEQKELEVDLVLGGDEGKECTYKNGYMKRQAIFSCLTCTPDGNAGVCTACSLSCHDGHEIVELWTKRSFRCDCGNSKFGEFYCKILPSKDIENVENSYNHNFKGAYCTCGRPYPDPDVEEEVEMIQCCVCEDWFHEEHIGLDSSDEIPRDEEGEPLYQDFICAACSKVCSFLRLYTEIILEAMSQKDNSVNTGKDKEVIAEPLACGSGKLEKLGHSSNTNSDTVFGGEGSLKENSGKKSCSDPCAIDADTHATCVIGVDLPVGSPVSENKPIFLSKNWRDALCKCEKCCGFYEQKHIGFLIDKEDSITEYEKMAQQKREQREVADLSMLDGLGHVGKIEVLQGIEDMKNELSSFLGSFDTSKTITSDDVRGIFENLKKRRRVE